MRHFLFFVIAFLLFRCTAVYIPSSPNAPLLGKGGEVQASGQVGISGVNLQSAIAITDHIAIMANGAYTIARDVPASVSLFGDDVEHNSNNYEVAAGYYKNYSKKCWEVFGGYGWGEGLAFKGDEKTTYPNNGMISAKYNRIFIQPSFGWKFKRVHLAITSRLSLLNYTAYEKFGSTVAKSPAFFLEPGVTAKFNFWKGRIFWKVQGGFTLDTDGSADDLDFVPINFSTGVGFRLNGIRKDN